MDQDAKTIHVQKATIISQQHTIRCQRDLITRLQHLVEAQDRFIEAHCEVAEPGQ